MSSKAEKTRTKKSLSDKSLAISDFAKQCERKTHIDALKAAQAQDLVEREIDRDKEIMENQISQLRFEAKIRASRNRERATSAANQAEISRLESNLFQRDLSSSKKD